MPRRCCDRIYVGLEAELLLHNVTQTVLIENLSESGMYAKVASDKRIDRNTQNSRIYLRLQLPSGNFLKLTCMKIWSHKYTTNSMIERMGFQIIDPSDEYKDFYHTLSAG